MSAAASHFLAVPCSSSARAHRRRCPEHTALYRLVAQHPETWLARRREGDSDAAPIPRHVESELRGYLECGILARGFARARCGDCGHDFLIAYPCKGGGVCPSCITRHMAETAADRARWSHGGGFSLHAAVRIEANDRAGSRSRAPRRPTPARLDRLGTAARTHLRDPDAHLPALPRPDAPDRLPHRSRLELHDPRPPRRTHHPAAAGPARPRPA